MERGLPMLERLREHPRAPRWTYACGDQLTDEGLTAVSRFAQELATTPVGWAAGEIPEWVHTLAREGCTNVPFYRRRGAYRGDFAALPSLERDDLRAQPWSFVPDHLDPHEMIVYSTSGTTATEILVPCHPTVSSMVLPLLRRALSTREVELEAGPDRVAIALVAFQEQTLTYPSTSRYLDGAGFVKVNLHPAQWRDPDDRGHFLDDLAPQVYTGDPVAFAELAKLPLKNPPRALVSSAMALLPGLQQRLEAHFGCPVLDVYSLTEARFLSVATPSGHQVLGHDVFVEILDPDDGPCPPGVRGEIAVTSGRNPFLPLLRYRTGDHAALAFSGRQPYLVDLEGRRPVVFRAADGRTVSALDVTRSLAHLPLTRFALHQRVDGSLEFHGSQPPPEASEILTDLFGRSPQVLPLETDGRKLLQYSSELAL